MSIITNFLKLIKPEKNDYVDVEEHISNNYDKIDTWARDLVINDLENGGVDKALSANQGLILDNKDVGIMGGRDGKFPLTAATKGNIYLLESTQKYYICINDYDGIQISVPNANFEELSVYTNRSKLDNLYDKSNLVKLKGDISIKENMPFVVAGPSPWDPYNSLVVGIKIKRYTSNISTDYTVNTRIGNNWTYNYFQFIIEDIPYKDIESVIVYCIYTESFREAN